MARSSECTDQYARKVLDTADIVREAILQQPGSEFPSGPMCVELVFLLVGVTSALTTVKGMAFEDYPCFVAE
jgi:hypothetical protein